MATKTTKSRISKSVTKKQGFQPKWWMAVGLIAVVAVVGLAVLRFSNAGTAISKTWTGADSEWTRFDPIVRTTDYNLPTANKTVLTSSTIAGSAGYRINNDVVTLAIKQYISACVWVQAPAGAKIQIDFLRGNGITPGQAINSGSEYGYTKYCSTTTKSDSTSVTYTYGYSISTPSSVTGTYKVWKLERTIQTAAK